MNQLERLFARVESLSFVSGAYAANTLSSFVAYIESMSEFNEVVADFTNNAESNIEEVSERVIKLLDLKNDLKFMHQYDAPVALYLYLVSKVSKVEFAKLAKVINLPENCWWSKQMLAVLKLGIPKITTEIHGPNDGDQVSYGEHRASQDISKNLIHGNSGRI